MKKDIEWLKKEIATEVIELEPNRNERWSDVKYQTLRSVAQKINQLDEPEVLSQEWIDENKVARINNLRKMTMSDVVPAEDLQNLIIPKQELPVIPRFVAEWIEHNGENEPSSTIHFTIFYLYANLPDTNSMVERRKPVVNWLDEDGHNYFKLIDAVRYGYEVEEEQKYYVSSRDSAGFWFLSKNNDNEVVIGTNKAYYDRKWESLKLTEEEIKDYDARYMFFAIPVEENE